MNFKTNIFFLLITVPAMFCISCNSSPEEKETIKPDIAGKDTAVVHQTPPLNKDLIIGDWVRTDAPYEIKISELTDGGSMKTGYFNPRSINVSKALWTFADNTLKIYIELRDVNYPGSNYNLTYFKENDSLAGKYFQAVEGVTYEVGFTRKK